MSEGVLLKVEEINVSYGTLQVLWDISLDVRKGEIVAIAGANGAGKTTLLKTIAGMMHPATGSIEFEGEEISQMNTFDIVASGISLIPEGRGLFPEMRVLENLMIGSYNHRARAKRKDQLARVYDLFPLLKDRKNQLAKTLSGGEQQMLAIGRGLMSSPELLIIDEMSLGLSPLIVSNLFQVLHEIKAGDVTILLVEQNVWKTLHEANRAYIIETGRIVMSGNALELCEEQEVRNAYFGV